MFRPIIGFKKLHLLKDPKVAGIYGRQKPLSYSSDFDKRDLLIYLGLRKRYKKRHFFIMQIVLLEKPWKKFLLMKKQNILKIEFGETT